MFSVLGGLQVIATSCLFLHISSHFSRKRCQVESKSTCDMSELRSCQSRC